MNTLEELNEWLDCMPKITSAFVYIDRENEIYDRNNDGTPIKPIQIQVYGDTREYVEKELIRDVINLIGFNEAWVRVMPEITEQIQNPFFTNNEQSRYYGYARIAIRKVGAKAL